MAYRRKRVTRLHGGRKYTSASRGTPKRKKSGFFSTGWLFGRSRIWKHSGRKGWWLN